MVPLLPYVKKSTMIMWVFLLFLTTVSSADKTSLSDTPSHYIVFGVGQVNLFNSEFDDTLYNLELTSLKPITPLKLLSSYGFMWSHNGFKYLFTDLKYEYRIKDQWIIGVRSGIGLYDNSGDIDLGHVIEFRSGAEVTYEFRNKSRVGLSAYHYSNSRLSSRNPGTESLTISYQIPFSF